MIYFIQNLENFHLKIGYTKNNPEGRLKHLQTGSSANLRLVCTMEGDQSFETTLHKVFKPYHVKGEWFRPSIELACYLYSKYQFGLLKVNEDFWHILDLNDVARALYLPDEVRYALETACDVEQRILRTEY